MKQKYFNKKNKLQGLAMALAATTALSSCGAPTTNKKSEKELETISVETNVSEFSQKNDLANFKGIMDSITQQNKKEWKNVLGDLKSKKSFLSSKKSDSVQQLDVLEKEEDFSIPAILGGEVPDISLNVPSNISEEIEVPSLEDEQANSLEESLETANGYRVIKIDNVSITNSKSSSSNSSISGGNSSSNPSESIPVKPEPILPPAPIPDDNNSPEIPDHECHFEWYSLDETMEEGICECGKKATRNHSMGEIVYIGNGMDEVACQTCDYKKLSSHVHTEEPENLVYSFKESNQDGTHVLETSYNCGTCHEPVTLSKVEDCDYETSYSIFSTYNSYNQHDRHDTCKVCNYEKIERENCTKFGDLQLIIIGSYLYEYYNCEYCNGYVDRTQHKKHSFGPWEPYDDNSHRRSCICDSESLGGRETEKHNFTFDGDEERDPVSDKITKLTVYGAECDVCGFVKTFSPHEHAFNNIGTYDFLFHPSYKDKLSNSYIFNPNKDADDWCRRMDFKCSTQCHQFKKLCKKLCSFYYEKMR